MNRREGERGAKPRDNSFNLEKLKNSRVQVELYGGRLGI